MSGFSDMFGMNTGDFMEGLVTDPVKTMVNAYDNYHTQINKNMEEWKDRLRQEWRDSMKLPRKKKKQRRKEILLDWQIACWNPFE